MHGKRLDFQRNFKCLYTFQIKIQKKKCVEWSKRGSHIIKLDWCLLVWRTVYDCHIKSIKIFKLFVR